MKKPLWWIKWTKYEYWPAWFFHAFPVLFFYPVLAIRSRALFYFTAANPGIPLGGFFGEKKYDIIKNIHPTYLPITLLIKKPDFFKAEQLIQQAGISCPFILKPDVGERGNSVKKIDSPGQLANYLASSPADIIAQEFITYPEEYGVLFYKFPDGSRKGISSIVKKGFLFITGDGKSTIRQLLEKNERARFQLKNFEKDGKINFEEVLKEGEQRLLQPIGNHCKGTEFLDYNHLINDSMIETFDTIAAGINGFFFGRFDIKCTSDADLQKGINIKVMEVNGTTSEPGHIYDHRTMNLFKAYRDIWHNMSLVGRIGYMNHKQFGVKYSPLKEFFITLYAHFFTKKAKT